MDELAVTLGMDPLELRERNWIGHQEFPYTTISGLTYDSGNYEAATARARELFSYDELRREQGKRREHGERIQLGIGVSTYTEIAGLAPSRWLGEHGYSVGGWEHATVRLLPTGRAEVVAGTSPHGQGHVTSFSQIVADAVGVGFEDVDVLHGDTDVAAVGPGHVWLTLDGGWRRRGQEGRGAGRRQGPPDRRADARSQPRRPGIRSRHVLGAR